MPGLQPAQAFEGKFTSAIKSKQKGSAVFCEFFPGMCKALGVRAVSSLLGEDEDLLCV